MIALNQVLEFTAPRQVAKCHFSVRLATSTLERGGEQGGFKHGGGG
jgi:hypothetical protein